MVAPDAAEHLATGLDDVVLADLIVLELHFSCKTDSAGDGNDSCSAAAGC